MGKRIIIVGGVAGGASAAARLDEDAEITIYERGEYISYANCWLPYHLGDVIASRDALLLNTPEGMGKKYNVAVQVCHEVMAINREAHTVEVKDLEAGVTTTVHYDKLVLATGSSPIVPPLPGIDHPKIMPLWTVPDIDRIKSLLGAGGAGEM
ncbi:NAD(P)/FAD-dependent oxidoreductase, partial [Eubacterium aggregans]|uniref:NAD(P)/FAD-dependent oxidoreductase n=1 Tax=Eubacterium aggregans TaxID=81409 RepID=UPI003F39B4AC